MTLKVLPSHTPICYSSCLLSLQHYASSLEWSYDWMFQPKKGKTVRYTHTLRSIKRSVEYSYQEVRNQKIRTGLWPPEWYTLALSALRTGCGFLRCKPLRKRPWGLPQRSLRASKKQSRVHFWHALLNTLQAIYILYQKGWTSWYPTQQNYHPFL